MCVHACVHACASLKDKLLYYIYVYHDRLLTQNGRTPLHESLARGHVDIMTLLMRRGADPNIQPKVSFHSCFAAK